MSPASLCLSKGLAVALFTEEQGRAFKNAKPFPHLVVDGFWSDLDLSLAESDFPGPADTRWRTYPDPKEYGKRAMDDPAQWGKGVAQFMAQMHSPAMLQALGELTGLDNLSADSIGGGMSHRRAPTVVWTCMWTSTCTLTASASVG